MVARDPITLQKLTTEHIIDAARTWDAERGITGFASRTDWIVDIGGRFFPTKALVGLAHSLAGLGALTGESLAGAAARKRLRELGFTLHNQAAASAPVLRTMHASDGFTTVPYHVETDGSKTFFLPDLKRTKGYQVGEKNSERYFTDYWEALAFLRNMPAPAFRRPNKSKIAGIVRCEPGHAEDVSVNYLNRLLVDLETKEVPHD